MHDLTEKDLYECIVAATYELGKLFNQKNLFQNHVFAPPQRQVMSEVLNTLLNKRRR